MTTNLGDFEVFRCRLSTSQPTSTDVVYNVVGGVLELNRFGCVHMPLVSLIPTHGDCLADDLTLETPPPPIFLTTKRYGTRVAIWGK